jgi:hypothetical protein
MVGFTEMASLAGNGRNCLTKGALFATESAFVEGRIPVHLEGLTGFLWINEITNK